MIRVLLIDDDELGNELIVYILDMAGVKDYNICTSGESALAFLNECKAKNSFPDVVFVDINMPGMNGFEFIRHYETNFMDYSPGTRIIFLTNSILANEKKQAMQHKSVFGFWNKPLTHERLKDLVEKITIE